MADINPDVVDDIARAAIGAQTQTAIGLNILVFSGVMPFSISPEQRIQRVDNVIVTRQRTNDQTIGFVSTALQDSALKWYDGLSSRDLDNKDWEIVKAKQIYFLWNPNKHNSNSISRVFQGSKAALFFRSKPSIQSAHQTHTQR
jgi:hypothetical protein